MSDQSIIFVGVAIYVVLMLVVGAYAAKKTHTAAEFIVAGRNMPMFLLTATIIATWFGGGTMMGVSGSAYDDGLLGVIADPFGATLALFLIGLFFARFMRRLRLLTYVEIVDHRFGKTAATITTLATVVSNIGWLGAMLVAFALVFQSLTDTPMIVGVIGGAVIVITYTMIGGLWAVALTDFLQICIIIVGIIVLFIVVLIDVGGWSNISPQLPENAFRLVPLEHTPEQWLNYVRMWLIFGLADIPSQTLLGRALAAKSERVAQNSFYLSAVGYLMFAMIPVTLGIIASVTMPELGESEAVIPTLAIEHLHPVAVAIFVGAILAAIMSTCDSSLLGVASLVSRNLLPLVKPDASDKLTLTVARLTIPFVGIIGIVIALKARAVYDVIVDANILALTATTVPFFLSIWWKKATRTGALAAMATGFATWLITRQLAPDMPGDLFGLGVCLVTIVVVSLLTQKSDPPRPARDVDGNEVELTNRLGVLK